MSRYTLFIANRLYRDKERREPVSRLATNLATFGIGIGLAVMIVSVCIVLGFKWEISSKVIGFGSDIEILNAQSFSSTESVPIDCSEAVVNEIRHTQGVRSIQRTSRKFGIIKTETDYKGIMFKGIGPEYNAQFIKKNLVEGRFPEYAKEKGQNSIIVSRSVARKMNLKLNDRLFSYFFENSIKVRRFTIVGIFETSMQQFDENVIYTNIYAINQLNKWDDDRCSSLELSVENSEQLDETYTNVLNTIHNLKSADGSEYVVYTVKQLYSQIFDWLKLLDLNIWVIIALMTILSSLTIISGLLILILEKTSTIGILKAMGASGKAIREIFIYYATFIIGRGVLLGYVIGLGLAFIQYQWHIVTLDSSKYYVSFVPIIFNCPLIILLGVATLIICVLTLVGPSYLVSRISPAKSIKFE